MSKYFRPCAGAIVFNKDGLVFLGNRIGMTEDAWQFPQGGIESGETPAQAALRELDEETSICSVKLIDVDTEPTRYEFDEDIKESFKKRGILRADGQDIYFALFYFSGTEAEINLQTEEPEFRAYQWNTFDFAVANIIDFKKHVYMAARQKFMPKIAQYLQLSS